MAGRLAAAGLEPGDRMITSAETSAELVVAHVAALRLGLVVVPVNGAYREREIAHIVRDARPSAALVDDRERGEWITRAADPSRVLVVGPDVELTDGLPPALDACAPDDGAMLCYTSGTTGTPKGALLTHGNVLASPAALQLAWRWEPDDRLVLALPLFHMHGLGVGSARHAAVRRVGRAAARFDPERGARRRARRARHALLRRAHDVRPLGALGSCTRAERVASLRLGIGAAARRSPPPLRERSAASTVLERYGLTETLMNSSNPYDGERRAGTVGFALPGVEIRLGEGDEILVRGPNVFGGYWEQPDASRAVFDADGWFATGDIGAFDDDGYLSIVGRSKELIISGGYNVYPREVEDVLRTYPGVADCAVVGTPSEEWGELVTAVVVAERRARHRRAARIRGRRARAVQATACRAFRRRVAAQRARQGPAPRALIRALRPRPPTRARQRAVRSMPPRPPAPMRAGAR